MFLVAVDAEERRGQNPREAATTSIRLASAIEVEWLAGLFPDAISEKHRVDLERTRRTR